MKTATFYAVIAIVASFGLSAFGQPPCNGGNGRQPGVEPAIPFPPVAEAPSFPQVGPSAANFPPAAPVAQVRITPLNTTPPSGVAGTSTTQSARISVVAATSTTNNSSPSDSEAVATLDPELQGLVGTWTAVSRFGEGELSTVELQLDDRGWATLTVPTKDGKRTTIKRRIQLENNELKLSGPEEKTLSLGKLIHYNTRQLVLERADGQVTFVRT